MSTERPASGDRTLTVLSAGLLLACAFCALLYFGFGCDLLAVPGLGVPCLFHALSGLPCPGCGMTRALLLVTQLQWIPALHMNPLVFVLLGFAALSLGEGFTRRLPSTRIRATVGHVGWSERLALPALGLVLLRWVHAIAA